MTPPPAAMGFRTFGGGDERGNRLTLATTAAPGRLSGRSTFIVLAFAGLMLLPALGGSLRVLTQHEVFAAQTAREMLATGEWVVPHFAGVPRRNKPPGMYWLIAGAMAVFRTEAEWVARLPAALAGVATALVVARLAARWLGDAAGRVAGLMQASVGYVLMQARLAEADMPLCLAVAVAMAAFARGAVDPRPPATAAGRAGVALAFGLATGASVVLKGPGVLFVLAGCLAWTAATGRWRPAGRVLLHPAAVASLIVAAGAWPLAAVRRDPVFQTVWLQETGGRFTGEFGESEPRYVYAEWVPLLLLPWLPFAVGGWVAWWRWGAVARGAGDAGPVASGSPTDPPRLAGGLQRFRRAANRHPRATFLAAWFTGGMLILTCSQARHKHYAIPMLPPATLVAAAGFLGWLADARRADPRLGRRLAAITALVGAAAAVLVFLKLPKAPGGSAVTVAAVAVGAAATMLAYAARRPRAAAAACFAAALAGGLGFQFLVLPAHDDYKASTALARRANAVVPPGRPIYLVALREPQVAYYLDRPLRRVDQRAKVVPFFTTLLAGDGGPPGDDGRPAGADAYVLCNASTVAWFAPVGRAEEIDRVDHLRRTEKDPLVLVRVSRDGPATAPATGAADAVRDVRIERGQ